jgi:hypothetical protein
LAVDFFIKRRDQLPEIVAILKDSSVPPQVINLSGCTIRFIMTNKATGVVVVDAPAVIVDAPGGRVKYPWVAPDTDEAGTYNGEFEVTFADTRAETFPNSKNLQIKVFADLGGTSL